MLVHNEYFQKLVKTTCDCGEKKTVVYAWGEYLYCKWRTVAHFCRKCFDSRVLPRLTTRNLGYKLNVVARTGHGRLPNWLHLPEPRLNIGCTLVEAKKLAPYFIESCAFWMKQRIREDKYNYQDSYFDLAVDCAHGKEIVDAEVGYDIPAYLIELAEEIMDDRKKK